MGSIYTTWPSDTHPPSGVGWGGGAPTGALVQLGLRFWQPEHQGVPARIMDSFLKGRDFRPYSKTKPRGGKTATANFDYGQFERREFASNRARYHRTGPAFNRFTTSSSQYGHF